MRKLGRRCFRPARSRKATVINRVVSHSDTPATGRIRSKVPPTFATDVRSWQRSALIPPAHKKRDSGFLTERRSRERGAAPRPVYRRRYMSTALLGSVSPGVGTLLNHEICAGFPPASIRRRDSVPVSGPRGVRRPITNENERARLPPGTNRARGPS